MSGGNQIGPFYVVRLSPDLERESNTAGGLAQAVELFAAAVSESFTDRQRVRPPALYDDFALRPS